MQDSHSEDPREEAGCVLWDLAATQTHADFLVRLLPSPLVFTCYLLSWGWGVGGQVENRVLEVLAAVLESPCSDRMRVGSNGVTGVGGVAVRV